MLAALIGLGSFLFHTFANSYAELADVVLISSFVALHVFVVATDQQAKTSKERSVLLQSHYSLPELYSGSRQAIS